MKYFAYGANMFSLYFQTQFPEIDYIGIAKLKGHQLFFHKLGNSDNSGKCNIIPVCDQTKVVYGVLYEIFPRCRYLLDKAEKLGYGNQEIMLKVFPLLSTENNQAKESKEGVFAFTYVAHKERVQRALFPYTWYKDIVVAGAKEHALPKNYICELEERVAIPDPDFNRASEKAQCMHNDS